MTDRGVIEAMLLSWSDSHTGRKVTFLLPDDGEEHPFKHLKCGPAHGQRVALSFALIADDETQTEPDSEATDARRARQSGDSDAGEPRGSEASPATECAAAQPEADAIAEEARGTGDVPPPGDVDPYHYQRQAGMRCREKLFCDFLSEQHCDGEWDMSRPEHVVAAGVVHDICLVKSRKEFDTDPDAAKRWRTLMVGFDEWRGLV